MNSINLTNRQKSNFYNKVDKTSPDQCWLWTGAINSSGYGSFFVGKKSIGSHRVAYILANGQIPETEGYHGYCVCHKCDVRNCVNPSHLFLGTISDNISDMRNKGREPKAEVLSAILKEKAARGERSAKAKLTSEAVLKIREIFSMGGITKVDLGKLFGVNGTAVSKIVHRKNWRHVA